MGRTWAIVWHTLFSIIAGVFYFLCVLPRWSELMGETPHTLGMAGRIASGALIGLAALPVVFTLLRTRKPELGIPQLALSMRLWSIIAHVLAGVLIIGAAISEIWLSLDAAGQWLFGIYGAAAAIAVLGIFGFYLSFVAELPAPPPKPIKLKEPKPKRKERKKRGKDTDAKTADESREITETEAGDAESGADEITETEAVEAGDAETTEVELSEPKGQEIEAETADESVDAAQTESSQATTEIPKPTPESDAPTQEAPAADPAQVTKAAEKPKLQNRRPTGKTSHRRRRTRGGGVAVED
ncbi:hypothetical protein A5791_16455 [Mycobacterium sp. 852002-51163_SCH5372311]|uniref:hypothetical protein n=1 Tax=Mycobacterium sp. 852002-51163_SCH5372311 TaxID=1834097 RepID=UPI000800ABF7|nr:hypothetical protein [Mycobacterium sp. 852002-51163_SCH5372311]OBF90044.1 hypothetical protein A5791_16455 [Mycobacterium sp. 852002-51163_SCH5372311]